MSLRQIGVIGAGQMGAGIAQVAAQAEIAVVMHDLAPEMCQRGIDTIARNFNRMIERGRFKLEERDRVMRRIETTTNLEDLAKVDFVIEAVLENEDAKIDLFKRLDNICPAETIFASNTSSISITRMGARTSRADRVIGMHFMNPVPAMKLVEIIRGLATVGSNLPGDAAARGATRQDHDDGAGLPGLHRQSRAAADDQRSDLHDVRRRRRRHRYRHCDEARH